MAEIAQEMGVELHLNEPVEQLDFVGRQIVGVTTNRRHYPSSSLVINSDVSRTMKRLVPDHLRKTWSDRKIAATRFSCSTFMMYFGVEGGYDLPHHTIHIARDYHRNLDEIENQHVLSADPSFYVQNACVTDATMAPQGHSTLYVLVPVTHQHPNVDWSTETPAFRDDVIRQLEKLGLTDLERRIRFEKIVTPDDWDSGYEVHNGATFNMAHSFQQMLHKRPNNRFEDLKGVYLVGGGTHPGSGLPVIYESARITSRLIAEDLGPVSPTATRQQRQDAGHRHFAALNSQ